MFKARSAAYFQFANTQNDQRKWNLSWPHHVKTTCLVNKMTTRRLLAIVTADKANSIRCQHNDCKHPVFKEIHVVLDDAKLKLIGSKCFADNYADLANRKAELTGYLGKAGKRLSEEQIARLVQNTEQLVLLLEIEYAQHIEQERLRLAQIQQQQEQAQADAQEKDRLLREKFSRLKESLQRGKCPVITRPKHTIPWSWADPNKSILALKMRDGTTWIRVFAVDGSHRLTSMHGNIDENPLLPAQFGSPAEDGESYVLTDLFGAIKYLRLQNPIIDEVVGSYRGAEMVLS